MLLFLYQLIALHPPLARSHTLSPSCSQDVICPTLSKQKSSTPPLRGLMSYSSSREAGLIKVERDKSLSCSLEFATLVIPREISPTCSASNLSLLLPHTHTRCNAFPPAPSHIIWVHLSAFLSVPHPLLRSSSLAFEPTISYFCLFSLLALYSPHFSFLEVISLTLCLYISLSLYERRAVYPCGAGCRSLPVGPVNPSVVQLAGLIDQRGS